VAKPQKTKYAILGLLSWKPMSGYDIKKLVEMSLAHFWNESYGALFPTLNRLVEEGLATKRVDPASGRRGRTVYRISAKGRRAFDAWLHEATDPPRVRNELLMKFFLSSRREPAECIRLLEEYREQQQVRLEDFTESEALLAHALRGGDVPGEITAVLDDTTGDSNQMRVFYMTLRHGILAIEARLRWIDEAVAMLGDTHSRR
jgi:DNA-binding PadR family transcriptional regulator